MTEDDEAESLSVKSTKSTISRRSNSSAGPRTAPPRSGSRSHLARSSTSSSSLQSLQSSRTGSKLRGAGRSSSRAAKAVPEKDVDDEKNTVADNQSSGETSAHTGADSRMQRRSTSMSGMSTSDGSDETIDTETVSTEQTNMSSQPGGPGVFHPTHASAHAGAHTGDGSGGGDGGGGEGGEGGDDSPAVSAEEEEEAAVDATASMKELLARLQLLGHVAALAASGFATLPEAIETSSKAGFTTNEIRFLSPLQRRSFGVALREARAEAKAKADAPAAGAGEGGQSAQCSKQPVYFELLSDGSLSPRRASGDLPPPAALPGEKGPPGRGPERASGGVGGGGGGGGGGAAAAAEEEEEEEEEDPLGALTTDGGPCGPLERARRRGVARGARVDAVRNRAFAMMVGRGWWGVNGGGGGGGGGSGEAGGGDPHEATDEAKDEGEGEDEEGGRRRRSSSRRAHPRATHHRLFVAEDAAAAFERCFEVSLAEVRNMERKINKMEEKKHTIQPTPAIRLIFKRNLRRS